MRTPEVIFNQLEALIKLPREFNISGIEFVVFLLHQHGKK
jgi:hypothetical protein